MIREPDQAILNKLSESAGQPPKYCEDEFDALTTEELDARSASMAKQPHPWVFVLTPTEERSYDWWVNGMMIYFKKLTVAHLSDGRLAVCTWAAK